MTTMNPPTHSRDAEDAIRTFAHRLLEHVQDRISRQQADDLEEFREQLSDLLCIDGTEVLGLTLDEQLGLVEVHADDLGLQLDSVDIDSLRFQIDSLACQVIHRLGEERAVEILEDLETIMSRLDLELSDLTTGNHLAHLPHQSERSEGDDCTVYEYHCDERRIDVYEIRLGGLWTLHFQKAATSP